MVRGAKSIGLKARVIDPIKSIRLETAPVPTGSRRLLKDGQFVAF